MDIEIFKEEMRKSQERGELSEYCLKNWEQALLFLGGSSGMDELIEESMNKEGAENG